MAQATAPTRHAMVCWRRVVTGLIEGVLSAALFLLLLLAYGSIDNRWYRTIVITGGSMSPTINIGDAIVITRPPATLAPGAVVTLDAGGEMVTHRVIEVRADGTLVTRGDANSAAEEWQPGKARIVGVYRLRVPYIGYLWIGARMLQERLRPQPLRVEWVPAG